MNCVCLASQLLQRFEPLTLSTALDVLYYLGIQNDTIIFKTETTTPDQLIAELYPNYHPRNVSISFWGGPPEVTGWYEASLYAFMLDKLARIIDSHGYDAAKRVLRYGIKSLAV